MCTQIIYRDGESEMTLNQTIKFQRGLELKNRVVIAPMTNKMSLYDGVVSLDEIEYYSSRTGEVGAFITAAANVSANGKGWDGELGVYDDKHIPRLAKLASAIKINGTKAILQLFHGGRMASRAVLGGVQPVSASAIPAERPDAEVPRELKHAEIIEIINDFKDATERAIKAGFDGVEIHGANTYLLQQFFSPHSNRRTDEWGGTLEKRTKFIDDVVAAVTGAVDSANVKDFIVGYRFSPEEYEEPGITLDDTLFLVERLTHKSLDYLHLSLNEYSRVSISQEHQDKTILEVISEVIDQRIPLIGVGGILTAEDAHNVREHAEIIAVGRGVLIDPHWTSKILDGREDQIRTEISIYEKADLKFTNGLWEFLEMMIPDKIN